MSLVEPRRSMINGTLGALGGVALMLALFTGCPRKTAGGSDADVDAAVAAQVDVVPATGDAAVAPGAPQAAVVQPVVPAGSGVVASKPAAHKCPAGEILMVAANTFCAKPCSTDAECVAGSGCTGS